MLEKDYLYITFDGFSSAYSTRKTANSFWITPIYFYFMTAVKQKKMDLSPEQLPITETLLSEKSI